MSAATSKDDADTEELLRIAVRHALNGDAVLFLGAGAARDAKSKNGNPLPTGQELSNALASDCGLGPGYSLDSITQHFLEVRSETALINALRRHLSVASIGGALLELAKIPWSRIWTTNYDDAFEQALDAGNVTHYSLTTAAGVENVRGNRLIVLHVNGALSKLTQSLTSDFILTTAGYSTQAFTETEWSTVFRNDLHRAKAIIFVGYSLADIDISRLVFNPALLHKKIHFIDRPDIDPVLRTKLSKFGMVHSIGLAASQAILEKERAQWTPPSIIEDYRCWRLVNPAKPLRAATDNDFYELIMRGVPHDELLMSQHEDPSNATYAVIRECESACISQLGQPSAVTVVVGSFASGKTIAIRSIALQLSAQGRDVFELGAHMEIAFLELQRLCRRDSSFVLVLENYSRNLDLIECFCRYARPDCGLLLTERTEIHELRASALSEKTSGRTVTVHEIDLLENGEISRLSALFNLRGMWGERAGLNEIQKIAYLKQDCDRQLQSVLIDVANSPQILARLADIVSHFSSREGGLRILIALCLLQSIGEQPRTDVAAELLQLSYDNFRELTKDEVSRQILTIQSGVAGFRSSVMARAVLSRLPTAASVTDVVADCVKRGEHSRRADPYLWSISKELMRFANLERILPEKGLRIALQNFYEDIKTVPSIRSNPHFWLQYAMARLSLGELSVARKYFEQSYSIASNMHGYDTFQIDNHYCRLLLREAEETTDADAAFKAVDEALQTLKKQVLRENRHYPYRSAWSLEGVAKRHGNSWSESQRQSVIGASLYLIDAAKRLDSHISRSVAVVGGIQRLKNVISQLS